MIRLDGQVAIVTGGARGIGKGVCEVFCEAGATVYLWDVLDGNATADEITAKGGKIHYQKVDITNRELVRENAKSIEEAYGKIDILINNAGIIRDRSFQKMSDDEWNTVLHVNLTGIFVITQEILPYMRKNGYGRIVSASSVNGKLGAFGQTNYAATKAGIVGFTKSLAREVGRYGITVNAVAPGFIESEMTKSMPPDVIKAGIEQIPVKRIGTPRDMGFAYLFLASKEAGFINGETLNANGGVIA